MGMEESKHTESVPGAEERKSIFKSILGATVALELARVCSEVSSTTLSLRL